MKDSNMNKTSMNDSNVKDTNMNKTKQRQVNAMTAHKETSLVGMLRTTPTIATVGSPQS